MGELIGGIVAFIIVFGIPYLIGKKNEKNRDRKNAEDLNIYMTRDFGCII